MKIVYLDAYAIGQEIDLQRFSALGDFIAYDRTAPEAILERAKDANIILTNKCAFSADMLAQLPQLKYIGVTATGYNIIDVAAARQQGITVTNAQGYSTKSVAQHVFAQILTFTNRLSEYTSPTAWVESPDWCYYQHPFQELAGKTLGIIGFGEIGQKVAQLATAFEMDVIVYASERNRTKQLAYRVVERTDFLQESDIISLHSPLTTDTKELVNADFLGQMKKSALLINTSRGGLVDENALAKALHEGQIAGAYLDVLTTEPPLPDNPLLTAPNCLLSPHIAWASLEARQRLMDIVFQNLRAFLDGKPVGVVH
ncbi:MAG: D-2-hydroxyacid dehydrogenase [Spirosomataceae bacterium]